MKKGNFLVHPVVFCSHQQYATFMQSKLNLSTRTDEKMITEENSFDEAKFDLFYAFLRDDALGPRDIKVSFIWNGVNVAGNVFVCSCCLKSISRRQSKRNSRS